MSRSRQAGIAPGALMPGRRRPDRVRPPMASSPHPVPAPRRSSKCRRMATLRARSHWMRQRRWSPRPVRSRTSIRWAWVKRACMPAGCAPAPAGGRGGRESASARGSSRPSPRRPRACSATTLKDPSRPSPRIGASATRRGRAIPPSSCSSRAYLLCGRLVHDMVASAGLDEVEGEKVGFLAELVVGRARAHQLPLDQPGGPEEGARHRRPEPDPRTAQLPGRRCNERGPSPPDAARRVHRRQGPRDHAGQGRVSATT